MLVALAWRMEELTISRSYWKALRLAAVRVKELRPVRA
jgi:hypothetical protein